MEQKNITMNGKDMTLLIDHEALEKFVLKCMHVLHNAKPIFPYYKQVKYAEAQIYGLFINVATADPAVCDNDFIVGKMVDDLLLKADSRGLAKFTNDKFVFPNDLLEVQKIELGKAIIAIFWAKVVAKLKSPERDQYIKMWEKANNE